MCEDLYYPKELSQYKTVHMCSRMCVCVNPALPCFQGAR